MPLQDLTYEISYAVNDSGLAKSLEMISSFETALGGIAGKAGTISSMFEKVNTPISQLSQATSNLNVDNLSNSLKSAMSASNELNTNIERQQRLEAVVNDFADRYNAKIDERLGLQEQLNNRTTTMSSSIQDQIAAQQKLSEEIYGTINNEEKFGNAVNQTTSTIKNNLNNLFKTPTTIPIGAKDETASIISEIRGNLARETASIPIKGIDGVKNTISEIKSTLIGLKPISVPIKALDATRPIVSKVKSELFSLVKMPVTIAMKAKDQITTTLSKIREGLFSLKTLAAGIVLGVAGKSTIGAAAQLEQEQIAMKHFISYNNPNSSTASIQTMTNNYIEQLRKEANATPFGTSEIIAAGRRAVNITSGDTKAGMDLVELSENMAALNPGKTVMDAMEALADLKTGETERMKEFGFKISQDDINKAGGINSYFQQQTSSTGAIGKVFTGGAKELSTTTAGQWSTVTGNLETIGANFGKAFLPVINKILTPLANLLDKNADKFTSLGDTVITTAGRIKTALTPAFEFLGDIAKQYIFPAISSVAGVINKYIPPIANYFFKAFNSIKPHLEKFWNIVKINIIPIIQDLWGKVKEAMPGIQNVIEIAFNVAAKVVGVAIDIFGKIAPVIKGVYDTISPILSGVIWLFDTISGAIKTAIGWLDTWLGKKAGSSSKSTLDSFKITTGTEAATNLITPKKNTTKKTTNIFDLLPGNAGGTSYFPGGLSVVGERGPEIVNLPTGSQVIPASRTSQILNSSYSQMSSGTLNTSPQLNNSTKKVIADNQKLITDYVNRHTLYGQNTVKNFSVALLGSEPLATNATTKVSIDNKGIMNNLSQSGLTYGSGMVNNLTQGVQASQGNLTTAVQTLTNKVIETFKSGFGIHSPSTVMYSMGTNLLQGLVNGMTSKDMGSFVQGWIGSMTGSMGGAVSGNVVSWLTSALAITGKPISWLPILEQLVSRESGGDPGNWNPISVGGEHATGLLQMLQSTFNENAIPGLGNILNPIANAASAIEYISKRYGSPANIPHLYDSQYVGYATGTSSATPGVHLVGEKGPELVWFRGGEKVTPNNQISAQRPYSLGNSNNVQTRVEPTINIQIYESKDPRTTADEVYKVMKKYFGDMFEDKMATVKIQMGLS